MPERIVTDSNGRKYITNEPLLHERPYSQSELDVAVVAAREQCAKLCEQQIAKALRKHGLTLAKTAMGYVVLKLGECAAHGIVKE